MAKFSEQVHHDTKELWQKSFDHPFIKEMVTGELPEGKFKFYVIQDYHYLKVFDRLHLKLAQQLPGPQRQVVEDYVQNLTVDELEARNHTFQKLGISQDEWAQTPLAPANYNYLNHMRHSLATSPAVGLASFLPCPWLYVELATHWQHANSPVEVYDDFFQTYEEAAHDKSTVPMIELMDQLAAQADPAEKTAMAQAFVRSSYYELQFWQMAYANQQWE